MELEAQRGSGAQIVDVAHLIGNFDDNSLRKELQNVQKIFGGQ